MQTIAVIGAGYVGKTIAAKLDSLGYTVKLGVRVPSDEPLQSWASEYRSAQIVSREDAISSADSFVFNCVQGAHSVESFQPFASHLAGKILVDVSNKVARNTDNVMVCTANPLLSVAEELQAMLPDCQVVKTLNTITADLMVQPSLVAGNHLVFMSGNEQEAKQSVRDLLEAFGWQEQQIIDLGDLHTARSTETALALWLHLWHKLGTSRFNLSIQQ